MSEWIDLTKPVDDALAAFAMPGYADPSFRSTLWSERVKHGFEVWHVEMATQTGTHVDAPSHFVAEGVSIDQFPAELCTGAYVRVTCCDLESLALPQMEGVSAILIDARGNPAMSQAAITAICSTAARMIILVGELQTPESVPFLFHRSVAEAGKFLVEDTVVDSRLLPDRGEYIVAPLPLMGLSGSPVRLLIR